MHRRTLNFLISFIAQDDPFLWPSEPFKKERVHPPAMENSKLLDVMLLTDAPVAAMSALASDEFVNDYRMNRPKRATAARNSFVAPKASTK